MSFDADGFQIVPGVLAENDCTRLAELAPRAAADSAGTRSLLLQGWCAALAAQLRAHPLLATHLPADYVAVQCTYFEKSAARNWLVTVHQDLSIPVAERVDAAPLQGWSEKEGSVFVQAPAELLAQLLAVRVHLDDCLADDGPLRVVPGSHRAGRLIDEQALALRDRHGDVACEARRGDALLLKPLLLHASSKARGQSLRRVLHFLFGPPTLPHGLRWQHRV